jgi:hypothetical protein
VWRAKISKAHPQPKKSSFIKTEKIKIKKDGRDVASPHGARQPVDQHDPAGGG